jgi:hypothetical protein
LTVHGVDKLVSEINSRKTPEGVAETEMKKQFLKHGARPDQRLGRGFAHQRPEG